MNRFSKLRSFFSERYVGIFGSAFAVLIFVFFAVMFSEWVEGCLSKFLGASEKFNILKFLGIGMGGLLLALQAFASHKRAEAMEAAANAQADAAKEQAKANQNIERGQRQERLKNAIEHLGHGSVSVRLGGAYELFHLARDTQDQHQELRQMALEILCAHIRQTTGAKPYRTTYKSQPSEEVQSMLTLLFVKNHQAFKGCRTDLQGSWLNGANLVRARLTGAILTGAYLQGANLLDARLQGAELGKANMQMADLFHAHLQGSNLANARMEHAILVAAQLQGACLSGMHLHGARLSRAQLQGAGNASWDCRMSFRESMRKFVGQETDSSFMFFDNSPSDKLPENSGAVIGAYTKEEAEQWIAEYEEAMSDVPKAGDS